MPVLSQRNALGHVVCYACLTCPVDPVARTVKLFRSAEELKAHDRSHVVVLLARHEGFGEVPKRR